MAEEPQSSLEAPDDGVSALSHHHNAWKPQIHANGFTATPDPESEYVSSHAEAEPTMPSVDNLDPTASSNAALDMSAPNDDAKDIDIVEAAFQDTPTAARASTP